MLVGAVTVDQAEAVSRLLTERDITHEVLTAKNHDREAAIIADAGRLGAVTVIAKMAGRGVNIILGGSDVEERAAVADRGGLCVLGVERTSERRPEMHLKGRAGRQGDPGESQFFMSYDDDIYTQWDRGKMLSHLRHAASNDAGYELALATQLADARQTAMAARHARSVEYDYDQVPADQRRLIYAERQALFDDLNLDRLHQRIQHTLGEMVTAGQITADTRQGYERKQAELGTQIMRELERRVSLGVLDRAWTAHLQAMADLLQAIKARSRWGQAPLADYQREATQLFDAMRDQVRRDIVQGLIAVRVERA